MERFCHVNASETSIIEETAKMLGCKPTEVFAKAAIAKGHIAFNHQAEIWISHFVDQYIAEEVVDYCLDILTTRQE